MVDQNKKEDIPENSGLEHIKISKLKNQRTYLSKINIRSKCTFIGK